MKWWEFYAKMFLPRSKVWIYFELFVSSSTEYLFKFENSDVNSQDILNIPESNKLF